MAKRRKTPAGERWYLHCEVCGRRFWHEGPIKQGPVELCFSCFVGCWDEARKQPISEEEVELLALALMRGRISP